MAKKITPDGEIIDDIADTIIARVPAPFWKTPFNHDTDAESDRTALHCRDKTKTQQQFQAETEINNILAQFMKTGQDPSKGAPIYQDADDIFDLQSAMVTGYEVEQAWNKLSAEIRNTLRDPRTFVEYIDHCLERGDLDELRKLGLANPKPPESPTPSGGTPAPDPGKEPPTGGSK